MKREAELASDVLELKSMCERRLLAITHPPDVQWWDAMSNNVWISALKKALRVQGVTTTEEEYDTE